MIWNRINLIRRNRCCLSYVMLMFILLGCLSLLEIDQLFWIRTKLGIDTAIIQKGMKGVIEKTSKHSDPLLVIFTTFKNSSSHHLVAHRIVIPNWSSFKGKVKPVLFMSFPLQDAALQSLIQHALSNGWDVLPIVSTNKFGTPYLKPMYREVFKRYTATFYGYANGDILFNDGLVTSLHFIESILQETLSDNVLLVGRRIDVPIQFLSNTATDNALLNFSHTSKQLQNYISYFNKSNLNRVSKAGYVNAAYAIDYFFFSKTGSTFDWSVIADVVIGRVAYDQYILAKAIDFQVNTVDISRSAIAVHLSKHGVRETGRLNIDKDFNIEVIGKDFPFNKGQTSTTSYYLIDDPYSGSKTLMKRGSVFKALLHYFCD